MPYWYLNKKTNEAKTFSSMTAIGKGLNVPFHKIAYQFSTKKRTEWTTEGFRIVKTVLNE